MKKSIEPPSSFLSTCPDNTVFPTPCHFLLLQSTHPTPISWKIHFRDFLQSGKTGRKGSHLYQCYWELQQLRAIKHLALPPFLSPLTPILTLWYFFLSLPCLEKELLGTSMPKDAISPLHNHIVLLLN